LNYFDQSHLVKEFKELTGFSPKTFFKQISPLENGTIQWMFTSNG
jgi:AraC-like DNA-binding protein